MCRDAFGQEIGAPVDGWVPRDRPSRAPIEGRVCRIESLDPNRHGADLFAAYADAPDGRDWTYLSVERPDDLPTYLAFAASQAASIDPFHHAILDRASGRAIGTAALMRIDPANGVIEIGFITFSPRLKRTRAGTEALFLLMKRAFDELGYRRLEWKCDSLNTASRRAALRLGFTFEGLFRQAVVVKGRNRDTAWYAITDHEWPLIRACLTRWLDPANFDRDGRQVQSLAACRDVRGDGA